VNLYDAKTFSLVNAIPVKGQLVRELSFTKNPYELIVITAEAGMRFYDIREEGGRFKREVSNTHRGSLNTISFSNNG